MHFTIALSLPTTYFGRPMGPGPWEEELVVDGSVGVVAVVVIAGPVSVGVSSLEVVVVSVTAP